MATVAAVFAPAASPPRSTTTRLRGGTVSSRSADVPASVTAEIVTSRGSSVLLNAVMEVERPSTVGPPGQNQLVDSNSPSKSAGVLWDRAFSP